jgi:hypothetical protein
MACEFFSFNELLEVFLPVYLILESSTFFVKIPCKLPIFGVMLHGSQVSSEDYFMQTSFVLFQ